MAGRRGAERGVRYFVVGGVGSILVLLGLVLTPR